MFPTREDVHGIKRLEVLRVAAASFYFKGYHATSMTEFAGSLGVTKAALYHYFPNKNSLLAAWLRARERISPSRACSSATERGQERS